MADAGRLEQRTVEVNDPELSADANRRLTEAVREVVGSDHALVPADRPHVSQGEHSKATLQQRMTSTMAMGIGAIAVAVCVGLVIVTALSGNWLLTAVTFVVLAIALAAVTMSIMGLASTTEYPDPGLAALLSEQGVRDPEVRFSALVQEFTPVAGSEDRLTPVEEDSAQASAEQESAVTPTGGPSTAVGPDT